MSSSMPTSLAGGRYQLGQSIGHGGMAEVYVGLDTRLGRTVAIKIMRAELSNDQIFLSRFRREAHSVAQMNNPNIVNIYDSGEEAFTRENGVTEHLPYLVMEYVKGQTLRDIIKANGALSQRDAEQVMLGVLNALEYSHRMGVIHRDIKPGNIMISEQGVVKVMDFGIARALDDSAATMTQSQGVVGTAQYLSPEQARGETVDMRSDLYSAGCVLYEMLTGRPPFTGDSAVAIAYQHVSEVATPPSAVVPGLPKMWDSICAKAMAKDRQNRYATAAEFKNDILTYMNGGVPVAAAFNPLTDLTNMKARKQAEQDAATVAMNPTETGATQAFNPVTGQFEQIPANTQGAELKSRAEQRAEAAKARRKRNTVIASVVTVIVLAAAAFCVWWFVLRTPAAQTTTVPELNASWTETQIRKTIEDAGLVFERETDTESIEPEGTFTRSDPDSGETVEVGSTVTCYFSDGPDTTTIPDVSNRSQDEARQMLEDAGFKVNTSVTSQNSGTVERDQVIGTNPAAGETAEEGTLVTLIVATGMVQIPDGLVGQAQDAVISTLNQNSLLTNTRTESSSTVPEGSVTRIEPGSGEVVAWGSSVTVWVSTGPEQVTVPNFTLGATTLSYVRQQLTALGLNVTVSGPDDDYATVTDVSSMGEQVDAGSTITVTTQAATTPGSGDDDGGTTGTGNGNGNGNKADDSQ